MTYIIDPKSTHKWMFFPNNFAKGLMKFGRLEPLVLLPKTCGEKKICSRGDASLASSDVTQVASLKMWRCEIRSRKSSAACSSALPEASSSRLHQPLGTNPNYQRKYVPAKKTIDNQNFFFLSQRLCLCLCLCEGLGTKTWLGSKYLFWLQETAGNVLRSL